MGVYAVDSNACFPIARFQNGFMYMMSPHPFSTVTG